MNVTIFPSRGQGTLWAPPSKSAAHRALIAAALSAGCRVRGVGNSKDIEATLGCLETLGAWVEREGDTVTLGGLNPAAIPACRVDCGESGSTLRFLIPLCLVSGNPVTFVGHGRLMERPLTEYEDLCREQGFLFEKKENTLRVRGRLKAGHYRMSAARSSQFITGMLYVLPLLDGESRLEITGQAQSMSYVDLTVQIMADFGVQAQAGMPILGPQSYTAPAFTVEGDWSNAAFPAALNYLGGRITVEGLRADSTQGDKVFVEYFEKLGKERLDLSDCPDLAPILFALAAVKGGEFTGCKRLQLKESDRIAAMQTELKKCGITLSATEDTVSISPLGLHPPVEVLDGHNDHRIVMAMSVLLTKLGGQINGAEAVAKSWPDFFEAIKQLGIEVKVC
ncbi:MAG: 3-phosphoshikimate 1-carboxyvinyltransferase [Clostridia bacterium]|nr:3-phosphoshikimate 1-carboxyvinyltransferase [Clostridia bacterium]